MLHIVVFYLFEILDRILHMDKLQLMYSITDEYLVISSFMAVIKWCLIGDLVHTFLLVHICAHFKWLYTILNDYILGLSLPVHT